MKPLLFLDFDGIINSENLNDKLTNLVLDDRDTGITYCQELVDNLSKFIKENDFNIVISSTWRLEFYIFELQQILAQFRIDADRVIDITPHISGRDRHDEISLWLETNYDLYDKVKYPYFFVLDDGSDAWTDNKNFYQVDVKFGFNKEQRQMANDTIAELRLNSGKFSEATYTADSVYELLELQKKLFAQGYLWKDKGHSYKNVNYVKLYTSEMGYIYWDKESVEKICNIRRPQLEYDIAEGNGELYEDQ